MSASREVGTKRLPGLFSQSRIQRVDSGRVYQVYRNWPALAEEGFRTRFEVPDRGFMGACVLGMGGSAAGGDILAGWLRRRQDIRFSVFKGALPPVDMKGTLAIACSASGETEETISMMRRAATAGGTVVCLSSGGRLEEEALALGLQHVRMPEIVAPRYMLPFIVFSCLSAVDRGLGLGSEEEARESIASMKRMSGLLDIKVPFSRNKSMQLAKKLLRKTPAILGDSVTLGVGVRFKNALNENAKKHAYFDVMPDLFHNEIQAWEGREDYFLPVFLRHTSEESSDAKRADRMSKLLAGLGRKSVEVRGTGNGLLSQLMTMVYLLDLATYYTAVGLGRDPLPTKLLDRLKRRR